MPTRENAVLERPSLDRDCLNCYNPPLQLPDVGDDVDSTWQRLLLTLPLTLMAVSFHEAAHAGAALWKGDATAARQGRTSLLPFSHIDPLGSLAIPLFLSLLGGPVIGFGKPTPVDPALLGSPKRDYSLVALAGPLANLGLALALTALGALAVRGLGLDLGVGGSLLATGILVNALLAGLNLLPLPGFDGLKALYVFLPDAWCWRLSRAEPLYLVILLAAAWLGVFSLILGPLLRGTQALCVLAGLPLPLL